MTITVRMEVPMSMGMSVRFANEVVGQVCREPRPDQTHRSYYLIDVAIDDSARGLFPMTNSYSVDAE